MISLSCLTVRPFDWWWLLDLKVKSSKITWIIWLLGWWDKVSAPVLVQVLISLKNMSTPLMATSFTISLMRIISCLLSSHPILADVRKRLRQARAVQLLQRCKAFRSKTVLEKQSTLDEKSKNRTVTKASIGSTDRIINNYRSVLIGGGLAQGVLDLFVNRSREC